MAGIAQLKSWFFAVTSTTDRLRKSDKPTQQIFENLLASTTFKTESTDRARISTGATLSAEQGLAVLASDVQAKANTTQLTDRSIVVQPHQLPTVESTTSDFTVSTVPSDGAPSAIADAFNLVPDGTTTRNKYILNWKTTFKKFILRRIVPAGGSTGNVLLKNTSTDYDYQFGDLAVNSTFTTSLLANTTFINSLTTQIITNNPIAIIDGLPTATVLPWSDDLVPSSKWMFALGTAISRTTYSDYFAKVGTTYGIGNGTTTFNIPDIQDKQLTGRSGTKALGSTGGAASYIIASGNLPTHTHDMSSGTIGGSGAHGHTWDNSIPARGASAAKQEGLGAAFTISDAQTDINPASGTHSHSISGSTGNGGFANTALTTLDPYLAMNFIVKVLP